VVAGDPGAGTSSSPPLELPPFTAEAVPLPPLDTGTAFAAPLVAGELPALPGAVQPTTAPALAAPPQVVFAPRPLAQTPFDSRRHTVPAALLLALLLAFAIRLQAEPARAPRSLGGAARARRADPLLVDAGDDAAVVPVRGVGRFRAPRPELAAPATAEQGVGRFRRTRSGPAVPL
jgi:hypothetical protein